MNAENSRHTEDGSPIESDRAAFQRLAMLVGETVLAALEQKRVIVFGLGGVGSWAAEALVRSGIGHITIVDNDAVDVSNINRQVQALQKTMGLPKATALKERLLEINPRCEVSAFDTLFSRETVSIFEIGKADYVIDAIDSLQHKLDLIEICCASGVTLYSSMGMARRLDPTRIKTADIWNSSGCPLARIVRQGLKKRSFAGHFTVVYSDEVPLDSAGISGAAGIDGANESDEANGTINGSAVTVTAAAGMILASLVIRDIYGYG